jgi:hypothetical protein
MQLSAGLETRNRLKPRHLKHLLSLQLCMDGIFSSTNVELPRAKKVLLRGQIQHIGQRNATTCLAKAADTLQGPVDATMGTDIVKGNFLAKK